MVVIVDLMGDEETIVIVDDERKADDLRLREQAMIEIMEREPVLQISTIR